jgi:hypothetical protein
MLDLGMHHFDRDRRLAVPDVLDPFIVGENPPRSGDRLVVAAATNFNRIFEFLRSIQKTLHVFRATSIYHIRFLSAKRHHPKP